mgnify:CR=1 FL=1
MELAFHANLNRTYRILKLLEVMFYLGYLLLIGYMKSYNRKLDTGREKWIGYQESVINWYGHYLTGLNKSWFGYPVCYSKIGLFGYSKQNSFDTKIYLNTLTRFYKEIVGNDQISGIWDTIGL